MSGDMHTGRVFQVPVTRLRWEQQDPDGGAYHPDEPQSHPDLELLANWQQILLLEGQLPN